MLDNFTVGDKWELANNIDCDANNPDLEKFAEYLSLIEDKFCIEIEDIRESYELARELDCATGEIESFKLHSFSGEVTIIFDDNKEIRIADTKRNKEQLTELLKELKG